MKMRTTVRRLVPLGMALLLTLGGCAQASTSFSQATGSVPVASSASVAVRAALQPSSPELTIAATPNPAPVTKGAGQVLPPLPSCTSGALHTAVPATLSFTISSVARSPWIMGNPAAGQGFEAAVMVAVAHRLGFAGDHMAWRTADPEQIKSGALDGSDVGVAEVRTPDQGTGPVDYSTGYFSISDSVVARVGSPAARVTGLSALDRLRLATVEAAGRDPAVERIASTSRTAYPTSTAALSALQDGSVDAVVVPTPDALTAGPDVTIVGQLPTTMEQPVQFGMVLRKNSPLTACVSAAIDELRVTGTLGALVRRWVPAADRPLK